ncbi:Nickel/cobalt efflux system RcnA [Aminobacter sp. MSH1]|uniref:nickel/cobalt efflux transporter n=1 Tax=Aminobacter sp. MSH1 TaxID=374606 RepID=UPI000D3E788F|nr:nickel/cobalt efflux transporter [Aminobacter sp. MSH1]AWC20872.1 Nickel/cobalt efflux system RcnA [Aminobacter sp. MSH1]
MPSFADLLQQGSAHAWLFIPSAILLGALHGLEPGHSKTMMAAFIVAVRGTVQQAILLGVAATISHTLVVWVIALGGMYIWRGVAPETFEPWLQLVSGIAIIGMALWMIRRTRLDRAAASLASGHGHDHGHSHGHDHGHHAADVRRIETGHGLIAVEVFEDGVPPRWRIRNERGAHWKAADVTISTERPNGAMEAFDFVDRGDYLESVDEIPEPHQFMARVSLGHGGHSHDYDLSFVEGEGHDHLHEEVRGLSLATDGYQDAHELAHANDIRRRFADQNVTTWQIVIFGLTGGLIPCPAAITVLLLCLQLKEIPLGAVLVLCFSIGLAITLVTVGAIAALSVRHANKRFPWLATIAGRAPYFSGLLIIAVGLYVCYHGLSGLQA